MRGEDVWRIRPAASVASQLICRLLPVISDSMDVQVVEEFGGHTWFNKAWRNHKLRCLHWQHTKRSLMACGFHQMIPLAKRVERFLFWRLDVRQRTALESCLSPRNKGQDQTAHFVIKLRLWCFFGVVCGGFLGQFCNPITCCRKASS